MDKASKTIDRHEPVLPEYIQGELTLAQEKLYTKIKNNFILRHCNVGQIKRWAKKYNPIIDIYQKRVDEELLAKAKDALYKCTLSDYHKDYLYSRGLNEDSIKRFNIVTTQHLVKYLNEQEIANLSLRISDRFTNINNKDIDGISIPYFYNDLLYGFCTRILNNHFIKYSITIPQRFCFGIDIKRKDYIIITEGIFDAIPIIAAGYHCMAIGDSQPNYWKMLQASKYNSIYLLFDNDYSGKLGAAKSHVILNEMLDVEEKRINILMPPDDTDSVKYLLTEGLIKCTSNKISLKSLAAHLTELGNIYDKSEKIIKINV